MWESRAAFWPDFPNPLREATFFVAFRGGVISTANRFCLAFAGKCFSARERVVAAVSSEAPVAS
jgi:hypothetical protein